MGGKNCREAPTEGWWTEKPIRLLALVLCCENDIMLVVQVAGLEIEAKESTLERQRG